MPHDCCFQSFKNNYIEMKVKLVITLGIAMISMGISAQSIWNASHLEKVKQSLSDPIYNKAYLHLLKEADTILQLKPLSVMQKEKTPASGDKHDYMSQARYFWPDPTKPDGKPYISRDGQSNPELEKMDRNTLGDMAGRVTILSLAWYFSDNTKYAQKATELIRIWFFNPETRMNPNLNYAQIIPGLNNDKGRCYGLIDSYSFVAMLDGIQLMEKSESFTDADSKQLKNWFREFLHWVLTSDPGKEESQQKNNHSVAYDAQVIALALYTGNDSIARKYINDFPAKRIFKQIEPDGKQPQELRRTLAFGYSQFNLHHMIDIFLMAQKMGIKIDNVTSPDGRNFYKAVDFLIPYLGKAEADWPYQQISQWEEKQTEFCKDVYRIYQLNRSRTDYLNLFNNHFKIDSGNIFNLLYYDSERN
jgi:unsaturated chondroitin disaccharide hydrolase